MVRGENTFVFTLNGLDTQGRRTHDANRTGWIYCMCLKYTELMKRVRCAMKMLG